MDAFVEALCNLSEQLLPFLRAVVLIALVILLSKLIKVFSSINETLIKTHNTISLVDKSIEKVQEPLDTMVKVSNSVDKAHDATIKAAGEVKDFVSKNIEEIKTKLAEKSEEEAIDSELKEPSPMDIIGDNK